MANDRMRAWLTRPGGLSSELVLARGSLSMRNLATRLNALPRPANGKQWSSSLISKLEHGQQLPTAEDLDILAKGLDVSAETRAAWHALLVEAATRRAAFARRQQLPTSDEDNLAHVLEDEASFIRATHPFLAPDLLRTRDYARHALIAAGSSTAEAELGAKAAIARQDALSDLDRAFQFLIPESALRTLIGGIGVMAGQLDRLVSASSMSNVQIAVLPQMRETDVLPFNGAVTVYDTDALIDDGVEVRHYGALEAAKIVEHMERLWRSALRGSEARKAILKVAGELSRE